MSPPPDAEEKHLFETVWLDYVLELGGAEDARQAWEFYLEERKLLLSGFKSGPMTVYRAIRYEAAVDTAGLVGEKCFVGRFWTDDLAVARSWDAQSAYSDIPVPADGLKVVVEGRLELDDVDIVETIACRLGSSWEREIRTKEGRPVFIVSVEPERALAPPH